MTIQTIFVTGGAGYIGSHTCVELLHAGYDLVVYDNLMNSSKESIKRVQTITGKSIRFIEGDIRNKKMLEQAIAGCDAVIHFAGLKAVGESVLEPLKYYEHNVFGTLCLLQVMQKLNIKSFVFSSSATVYGIPEQLPLTETHSCKPNNPYGYTKWVIENMCRAVYQADRSWQIVLLRYFNPVGAHESGLIGEDPNGIPNNLMPFITQVAVGKLKELVVFGNDYDTADGTGVRDYIHVVDLARGHLCALKNLNLFGCESINLGTGIGYSVLDVLSSFEEASGKHIPYQIKERRAGDVASCYASCELALSKLGWKAEYDLARMCSDSWRWQQQNPSGYN